MYLVSYQHWIQLFVYERDPGTIYYTQPIGGFPELFCLVHTVHTKKPSSHKNL